MATIFAHLSEPPTPESQVFFSRIQGPRTSNLVLTIPSCTGFAIIKKAVQPILLHDPCVREAATRAGVEQYVDVLLNRVVKWVAKQFPTLGLYGVFVWYGAGQSSIYWAFPPAMQPQYRTLEQARELRREAGWAGR